MLNSMFVTDLQSQVSNDHCFDGLKEYPSY